MDFSALCNVLKMDGWADLLPRGLWLQDNARVIVLLRSAESDHLRAAPAFLSNFAAARHLHLVPPPLEV